jgi:hypothetical protein
LIVAGLGPLLVVAALTRTQVGAVFSSLSRNLSPGNWVALLAASLVLLLGHVLRAARTKVPLDNVRRGSLRSQFQALSIGYLFDVFLPLRLGEVVRSFLIARNLRISFLYTLAAVVLERLIDVILVATAFLGLSFLIGQGSVTLSVTAAAAVFASIALIFLFILFVHENDVMLRIAWRLSSYLNAGLSNRMRFKIWSLIFGFQRFFLPGPQLVRYAVLVLASWASYVVAAAIAAFSVLPALTGKESLIAAAAPYAVVSPSLGSISPAGFAENVADVLASVVSAGAGDLLLYGGVSWVLLNVPILLVGVISLFLQKLDLGSSHPSPVPLDGSANKLRRDRDMSQEFPSFLDSYFRRERLSQVLHKLEVTGNVSIVKFFKGSSNAVTILAHSGDGLYVKKMVPPEYAGRLKNQHDWLVEREALSKVVSVLREERADDYYAIDLEYRPESVPLFDYIHERPLEAGVARLEEAWSYLYANVYAPGPLEEHRPRRDEYVHDRLVDRLRSAALSHPELALAMQPDHIRVNGRSLDNFEVVMDRIQGSERAWRDLATYRASPNIHGDLTVDNILVDLAAGDLLLIDPSDDNQICGPVIDFGRLMQSLSYGYEFLNLDEEPIRLTECDGVPVITYRDNRSARYAELESYVRTELIARHLSAAEQRAILFHVGLFFGRMLTHRVVINPDTVLKYYGACIQALNGFIDQYELPTN